MKHTHNKHGGMIDCEGCQPKKQKPEIFYRLQVNYWGNIYVEKCVVKTVSLTLKSNKFHTKKAATAASKAIRTLLRELPHS